VAAPNRVYDSRSGCRTLWAEPIAGGLCSAANNYNNGAASGWVSMSGSEHLDELAWLLERRRLEDLIIRYATALDIRDWADLRACFTDDAVADYGNLGRYEGVEAILQGCREPLSRLDSSQHLISNVVAQMTGDGRATVTAKVQAQHFLVNSGGEATATIGGTYVDEVVRGEDGWRIAKLTFSTTWRTGNSAILAPKPEPDRFGRSV